MLFVAEASSPAYVVTAFYFRFPQPVRNEWPHFYFSNAGESTGTELCHFPSSSESFSMKTVVALSHAQNRGPGSGADPRA